LSTEARSAKVDQAEVCELRNTDQQLRTVSSRSIDQKFVADFVR
jgi:hypothetical protein